MTIPDVDQRSPARRARDEQIAAEPPLHPRVATRSPSRRQSRPTSADIAGAPWRSPASWRTDWSVRSIPESNCRNTRVIIVASEAT